MKVDDNAFLTGIGAVRDRRLTHTGLLLFGRESRLAELCPQHQVHYVYLSSPTAVARNDSHRCALLHVLERLEDMFSGPLNPERELAIGFFMLRIPAFPPNAIREAWLNAVTHRDYADSHEVLIRHTAEEVVVTSPGGFLGGITPRNILRHDAVSRNPTLAEAFQKLRLVERAGVGRRRIFLPMLEFGKEIPVYQTDGTRVKLRFFNGDPDTRMATLVVRLKKAGRWSKTGDSPDLDELLVLSYLRRKPVLDAQAAAELLHAGDPESAQAILERMAEPPTGLLERARGSGAPSYQLTPSVARELRGEDRDQLLDTLAAEPTAARAQQLLDYLIRHGAPTAAATSRLRHLLASEAGAELERVAPVSFAALHGIAQAAQPTGQPG
ncbi:MAG: hypothetical protein GY856_33520 [bacterium]|nr:hypothetical protein [bacterium]